MRLIDSSTNDSSTLFGRMGMESELNNEQASVTEQKRNRSACLGPTYIGAS
ncbi:MAG: hypothetical protein WC477_04145 [Patescibacteria group bacterium]